MKRKLLLAMLFVASAIGFNANAADYLTDFSSYTVTKTAVSNDNTSGTAREFWRGGIIGFDVNGTSTTIPNGVYSFSVQAVYRGHLDNDIPTGIIAYAESNGAQYMTPICNKTDGTVSDISLAGFKTAFETPSNYLNTIPYIIVTDGKIKVGVKSMSTQPFCDNGMWFIFNTASFKVSDVTDASVLATALSDTKAQAAGLLASNSDETPERSNLQSAYDDATAKAADVVNLKQKIDTYLTKLVEIAERENPRDVSYYFTNPKYSIRNLDLVGGLVTSGNSGALGQPLGWTCFDAGGFVDNGSGNEFQKGQGYNWFSTIGNTTEIDGHTANYDAEKTGGYSIYQRIAWNQWAEQTHSAKQTVTLPAGAYKLSVPAYSSANDDDYKGYVIFTVNGANDSRTVTAGSWNVYEKKFILTEPTDVSVDLQFNKLRRDQNVASAWAFFDGVTLLTYGDPVSVLKKDLSDLQSTIDDDYLNNASYTNVVGTERTNLNTKKTATAAAETVEAYQTAIDEVNAAINTFTAAKTNYDALVAEISKAKGLGIGAATANGYAATSSSTAATALTSTQNLKVEEYSYVTTSYPYSVTLGSWTSTGDVGTQKGQHWNGTNSETYYEQSSALWSSSAAWEIGYNQDVTLPAGEYVFKVAGRHGSQATVCNTIVLTVTNSSDEVIGSVADFPIGDTGLGINTSGATDYTTGDGHTYANSNNGRGWEWRYVKFSLDSEETINIAVSASSDGSYNHQWVGFCDATLETDNANVQALLEYNVALREAIMACDNATYVNVTGTEKTALQEAIDADASLDKTDGDAIVAAKNNLVTKTTAFTGAKTSYDKFVAAKAVEYEDNLPYASATKFAAIATAQAATATSASDADTKVEAILSAYRLYVESNALAEGVGGVDKTNLISDANFSGVTIDGQNAGAWAFSQTGGTASILSSQSFTDGSGNANYSYFDYNNDGANNQNLSQTLTALPKGQYLLTVTARATSNMVDNYYVSVDFDEKTNRTVIPAIGNSGGVFGSGWNDVSVVFNHVSDGDVTVRVYGQNGKSGWSGATRFRLAKIDKAVPISSTIGVATLYTPYALDFSEVDGLKAYTASVSGEEVVVTKVENVPANTGVILKGAQGSYIVPVIASSSTEQGDLTGNATDATAYNAFVGFDIYVLAVNGSGDAQFQKATSGSVAAGKAFLKISDANPVKVFRIVDGTATGVEAPVVTEAEEEEEVLYNTAGVRVGKDYKGIVINQKGEKRLQK